MRVPNAAPNTPKDEMLAVRLARPDGSPFHSDAFRSKSFLKDWSEIEAPEAVLIVTW